jgi:DnaJ-class molecular chaperone
MDYYSTLGVNKNASQEEIRKAYKKQSMKHHPDRGGNEEQFKRVNEAYQTLSDPQKRAAYDNPQPQYRFNTQNMGGFEDIFAHAFGNGFQQRARQRRNKDVTIQLKLRLEDIISGKALTTRYQLQSGKIKEADIDIPPGMEEGMGIRFEGLGDDSYPQFPPGDLIVRVQTIPDRNWRRDKLDLHTKITISIFDCLLGGKTELRTVEGKHLELKIPQGTQPSATFSIPGHGIPDPRTGKRGNIFVKLNTIVPKINDANIMKAIEKIRDSIN